MDFATFISKTDSKKLFLVEINKAEEIEDYTWTQDGVYTNCYWATYTNGVPNKVTEDDTVYVERFASKDCDSDAESFYYDLENQKLYLHTVGSDDPGTLDGGLYKYKIVAFSWTYICNDHPDESPVTFQRQQEILIDSELDVWTTATNLTFWSEWTAGGTTSINREGTSHYSGGYCARIDVDATPNAGWIYQDVKLPPSTRCKLKFRYKHNSSGASRFAVYNSGTDVYLKSDGEWQTSVNEISLSTQTSWTEYELEFYVHADYTNYIIALGSATASKSAYFDLASLTLYREENQYLPYLMTASMPTLTQAVSDYHVGSIELSMGRFDFINDGYWYTAVQDCLWHKKEIIARYGFSTDLDDFGIAFVGYTKEPTVNDTVATMNVTDSKVLTMRQIPINKYWVSNFPNLVDGAEGLPIPYVYGEVKNIIPTEVNTNTFKYKIADHALQAIDYVYKDNTALIITTDYTVNLADATIDLVADPEDALITCDVKGKKCDMEDGTYTENVADILYDILTSYVGIDKEKIDYESFLDLQGGRTQDHMLYIDIAETAMESIRRLMASALFHLIPLPAGTLGAFRYVTGVDSDTTRIIEEEHTGFQIKYHTTGVYSRVKVRYNRNPGDSEYEVIIRTNDDVERKYGIDETFLLTSTLRVKTDAENIGDFYSDLLKDPMRKVTDELPVKLFSMRPAEKLIMNKVREDRDGNEISILSEAPYRVLRLEKNFSSGAVRVEAWEDLQSAGETYCEVCYDCQTCYIAQEGSCSSCFVCQLCDSGQCDTCQTCYYCEKCDSGECVECESCDYCQSCDSCEAIECASCVSCETCNTCQQSECGSCQVCFSCEKCDTCQKAECDSCQVCNICQKCDSGECTSCQTCDECETCNECEECFTSMA